MSLSCWCGFSNSNFVHDCAVCSSVARGITGWPISHIPSDSSLDRFNSILKPGRGLTLEQRQLMLAESETADSDLPRAFRSKRGKTKQWSEQESERWREFHGTLSMHGNVGITSLPLPGGSTLFIDGDDNVMFVDKVMLEGPLPLLDLAKWLANPGRPSIVSDWKWFLIAMSCCMRECKPGAIENWSEWYIHNSWQSVTCHMATPGDFTPEALRPPYLKWIKKMEEENISDIPERKLVDGNIDLINYQGGTSGNAWNWILSGPNIDLWRNKILHWQNLPKLVVVDNRFCFLALERGKPTAIPVVVDPRVWRILLSWAFEPQESDRESDLSSLFWCWNSEFERWQPNNIQSKSIKFLRDTVDSLGDYSSLSPEIVNEQNAIKVVGKSGLIYLLSETVNPIKYDVKVIPYESMISEIDDEGLPLCIDSQASIHFPPGDVVASYLLALHNDVESRSQIFTLDMLLNLLETFPNWKNLNPHQSDWWDTLLERYNPEDEENVEVEYDDEDYFEEEDFDEDEENQNEDVWEGIELAHNQRIRHIILEHLNTLPNADAREQFRDAVENIFERFGGNIAELEESV